VTVESNRDQHHKPGPSLWPFGFALGIACVLVGLIVSWPAVAVGAAVALLSGVMWVRDAARDYAVPVDVEPERRELRAVGDAPAAAEAEEPERFPRSVFLEGATLGVGALIGGAVAVPALGFMVLPAFLKQHPRSVDIGPITNYPEGSFVIATFLRDPAQGEVTRRTAYIRNNGVSDGKPSFTIVSNRCAHLGCPVQPNGPVFDKNKKVTKTGTGEEVTVTPTQPAGFGCPCHGGQYDIEGNRTAGPPVRALDRYDYEIVNGHLVLLGMYSVSHVDGQGAAAKIHKYTLTGPGQHVDGIESWLYPIQPPH
jgi:Rieske Fe-S protein